MILSLILISLITAGGFALTYLISDEETLAWRIGSGCVIGSALFGLTGFVLASVIGLNSVVVIASLAIVLAPILIFRIGKHRRIFTQDRSRAKGKLQGASAVKALRFAYYAFFFFLFLFFFDRAMTVTEAGIFTGGSNNLGDLPFHLGAIYSFLEIPNFPPDNPNFAGVKFTYPFLADLMTAMFMKLGVGIRDAMFVQNLAWALSLLVIVEGIVFKFVRDRMAAKIAPVLLFFSGGLGFIWFFGDQMGQARGFFDFLWNLPKDYTIGDDFRWGNSLTTLFLTQRSLSLGMPLTLFAIAMLWKGFSRNDVGETGPSNRQDLVSIALPYFLTGAFAGTLALIHVHSLAVLFVLGVFLLLVRRELWREWIAFAVGVSTIALPLLVWSMTGSATQTSEFIGFHFGWDKREDNFAWFWLKNTGLLFPLLAAGAYLIWSVAKPQIVETEPADKPKKRTKQLREEEADRLKAEPSLLLFYIPFAFLFVVSNVFKLAPWEWDNIKVLIYWFVMSIPFVALALSRAWRHKGVWRPAVIVMILVLTMSGGLDVWRTVSRQINYRVFDSDAIEVSDRIRASTRPQSIFLNAPTYNSAVALSGRTSLIRYPGHLGSHGIDYKEREEDVKTMYRGGPEATELLRKYGVTHVLISPEEVNALAPNEQLFSQFPVVAQYGPYRVYKVDQNGSVE